MAAGRDENGKAGGATDEAKDGQDAVNGSQHDEEEAGTATNDWTRTGPANCTDSADCSHTAAAAAVVGGMSGTAGGRGGQDAVVGATV